MTSETHPPAARANAALGYRAEIDALRAIAVIAVIINHANKNLLPSGYLGVDIFFVISGYVITASLFSRQSSDLRSFLSGFYARRFRRLLPALLVYAALAGFVLCFVDSQPEQSLATGMAALFGVSNLYLLSQSANYFSPESDLNIFTHTWSLGVEEQFYLLFPLLFWACGLARQQTRRKSACFAAALVMLTVASWFLFRWLSGVNYPAAYFLMPARFWELAVGSLAFLVWFYVNPSVLRRLGSPLIWAALLVAALFLPFNAGYSYKITSIVVLLSCLLILSMSPGSIGLGLFKARPLVFIGLISYSLYLWHWAVLCMARWTVGIRETTLPWLVVLMLSLSLMSYFVVELKSKQWLSRQTRGFVLTMGSFACSLCLGFLWFISDRFHTRLFMSANNYGDRFEDIDGVSLFETCDFFRDYRQFKADRDLPACTFAPFLRGTGFSRSHKRPHLFWLGNSHAAQYTGLISSLRDRDHYLQTILYVGAIMSPPLPMAFMPEPWNRDPWTAKGSQTQKAIASKVLAVARPDDIIILGNNLSILLAAPTPSHPVATSNESLDIWIQSLLEFADQAAKRRLQVVVMLPIPSFPEPYPQFSTKRCMATWFRPRPDPRCYLSSGRYSLLRSFKSVQSALLKKTAGRANIHLYSGFDLLCPAGRRQCVNSNKDGFIYWDASHLNNRGSALLADSFASFLRGRVHE
ncbi:MAG: acyltransferase family protein [Cyanobium sp.]